MVQSKPKVTPLRANMPPKPAPPGFTIKSIHMAMIGMGVSLACCLGLVLWNNSMYAAREERLLKAIAELTEISKRPPVTIAPVTDSSTLKQVRAHFEENTKWQAEMIKAMRELQAAHKEFEEYTRSKLDKKRW